MKRILTVIALLAFTLSAERLAAQATTPPSLTGSWQLTLLPTSPAANAVPNTIEGLVTFTSDGTLVETDAAEVSNAVAASAAAEVRSANAGTPGHGIWEVGPALGNYYAQFVSLTVGPAGKLLSRRTVTINGALDSTGNHFAGAYTAQVVSAGGQVTGTTSGSVAAVRMVHPLLP